MDDRDVMERAQKAFVSFVRAYNEHHCNFIFRLAQLDLGKLATGMALLYLPIMSELKGKHIVFTSCDRPPYEIAFKDKQREKQRLQNYETKKQQAEADRAKRELIRSEKARAYLERRMASKSKKAKTHEDYEQEWKELQRETSLAKRVDKGALSREDFEIMTGERLASTASLSSKRKRDSDDSDASDEDDEESSKPAVKRDDIDMEALRSKKQLRKQKLLKRKEKIAKMKQDVIAAAAANA
jgi:hypothetical protein